MAKFYAFYADFLVSRKSVGLCLFLRFLHVCPHPQSPTPTPLLWRMFVFRLKYFLWLLKSSWICFIRSYIILYGTKMSILENSIGLKAILSDMMVLSIEFDKQEMKFMFRPPNCCNMSSCEGKCRPRDPFPTIALLEMRKFYL